MCVTTTNIAPVWRAAACLGVAAVAVALTGCGGGSATHGAGPSTSAAPMSLAEYAKRDCAMSADFTPKMLALQAEIKENIGYPAVLGDTVSKVAKLLGDLAAKAEALGDPPNGEAVGSMKAGADVMRSTAEHLERIASNLRAATTDEQIGAAVNDFMNAFGGMQTFMDQADSKYPSPKLDAEENKIPGCAKKPG
ncbi:hypothetical protein [Mycobacterium sp. OTB74]|jgi:hypothetical protein|uniref:hypothetical protein n=1 Tax=Mycobacterium sp. OTB74 TaxID=1853452 RepID=UPI0024762D2A|nr:hypothetical protein [Mycobacterium sp. OTB74]MDH6244430.1 hypothetical protein [Mycobacterium sp. OTB74]